ncbi:MAG: hypothetical protein WBN40_09630, partial [Pseudomonadales bacterium]
QRISYEALVDEPENVLRSLCNKFAIEFNPAMLNPYEGIDKKMVDGIYPESRSMTDPTLLKQQAINPALAQQRKQHAGQFRLGRITQRLATDMQNAPDSGSADLPQAATTPSRSAAMASLRKRRQR